jgi:hypothetical protein
MKKLILILAILISFVSNSQSRIGFTYNEIKNEFSEQYTFTTGYRDELGKFLEIQIPGGLVTYYFTENNVCYFVTLLPETKGDLHFFIEEYNKKYVILSRTSWLIYTDGYQIKITLEYLKDGMYYFCYSL